MPQVKGMCFCFNFFIFATSSKKAVELNDINAAKDAGKSCQWYTQKEILKLV